MMDIGFRDIIGKLLISGGRKRPRGALAQKPSTVSFTDWGGLYSVLLYEM